MKREMYSDSPSMFNITYVCIEIWTKPKEKLDIKMGRILT